MGTAREPRVGGMNEIVNIIDRRAGARGGRVCCVGRPVENVQSDRAGAENRRNEVQDGKRGTICMPARRDVAPPRSAFATRERRIEVITSLPFEDKRDILCFFRHIIGSAAADPAGRPINPGLFLNPATSPPGRPACPGSSLYGTLYPRETSLELRLEKDIGTSYGRL